MKVLGIVGSPRIGGNTDTLVNQVLAGAASKGAQTKSINVNQLNIKGCQSCMYCRSNDGCAVKDDMQDIYKEIQSADVLVIGSPVYMFQVSGQTKLFLDRLLPYLNPDYTSKLNKKSILVYTQGNADQNAFTPYLDAVKTGLNLLGLAVQDTIHDGGNYDKGSAAAKTELMQRAKKAGEQLLG
jgi:multimeric flavodoxin WrbA